MPVRRTRFDRSFEGVVMVNLNPYLSFQNSAREALEFYQSVLGGTLDLSEFGSMPEMAYAPDEANLIMHGQLTTEDGLVLMASDTPSSMTYEKPQGISVSLSGNEGERLHAAWDGLANGGQVVMPLDAAPWGGEFGMLVDRFGISWMVAVDEYFG
ncbi:VOC family protein [Microbacterium sp. NPDC055903]